MTLAIAFTLNGAPTTVEAQPERTLLEVLRHDLDLTGTKKGCDNEGQCGACTVIMEGRAIRACRLPIEKVSGKHVVTIEGIGGLDRLHPLQRAFIDCGAVQCGFCTPGMITAAKALLDRNPKPSRDQIRRALGGNICRCTGYVRIIDAVMVAAAAMRGETSHVSPWSPSTVGGDPLRVDAVSKVTGRTRFAADITMPDMLVARVLRSPYAHAYIADIDATAALEVPGVKAVYTADDIPGVKAFSDLWGARDTPGDEHPSLAVEPILAIDRVRMLGEPVAMVVADSDAAARSACDHIRVRYADLNPISDPETALQPLSVLLHGTGNLYEASEIKARFEGDGPAETQVHVEASYSSPSRDHAALELASVLAFIDEDGRLNVTGPTHQPHARRNQIAEMLAISPDRVRVIAPPLGGSFGGRHHFWPVVACALPAYLLQRPVQLTYSRSEEFEASLKDHPFRFKYRIGSTRDGRLTSLWARAYGDAGPYGGAPTIAPFVALCGAGPYVWQTIDYEVKVAHTNGSNSGPLRGYGMPHGVFALECCLDELATELSINPWDLRMLNAADETTGACTGQPFDEPFGFKDVLKAIKPDWDLACGAVKRYRTGANDEDRRGAGLATSWYQFGKSGELRVSAQAKLSRDGKILIYYCAMNSGQGLNTVMSQLAAAELGVRRTMIVPINGDTDCTPDSHIYGASKTTYWVGGAIIEACRTLKRAILHVASETLGVSDEQLDIVNEGVSSRHDPARAISLRDLAGEFCRRDLPRRCEGVFDLEARYPGKGRPRYLGHFSVGAAIAEVIVNVKTGKVRVLRVVVAQDVGRAINAVDVRGQIEGAAVMELGAALMEEHVPGKTLDFKSYPVPRTRDVPELKVVIVEVPGLDGPYGVKGVGEAAGGHVRAAIINAIHDAIGVRIRSLPATPGRVREALQVARSNAEGGSPQQ